MDDLKLGNWMPMSPEMGPPLPKSMEIYWPWYKPAIPQVVELPPAVPVVAPPVAPPVAPVVVVAPPAAPPVIAYPPYPPVAYPPMEAPPVIVYPPAPPPPEVPAPPEAYYLYVDTVGEGVVTPSTGDYPAHLRLTLIATPALGYDFDYWGGDVSGTIPAVSLLMDSDKAVTAYFKPIPAPPPKLPTVSISSATFTPSEATVGDVVSGTISWMPRMPGSPELFDFGVSADLIDSAGRQVMNVFTASPTGEIGMLQATPFSLDTRGLPEGWYGLQVHFSDLTTGAEIAKRSFSNLLHLLPVPEIPAPPEVPVPKVPEIPPEVEISITAPDSAKEGEKVVVDVKVTNLMEDRYHLGTELSVNAVKILGTSEFISGGSSKTYSMMFYMPKVIPASLLAVVKYPVAGLWVPVDSASKTVSPEMPVPGE